MIILKQIYAKFLQDHSADFHWAIRYIFFLNTLSHDLHMITLFAYNQPIDTFGIYISQPHARLTENHPLYKL